MVNYMVIQKNDESVAYAFKIVWDGGYKPGRVKIQREQYTVTGKLDIQVGVAQQMWQYVIRLYQDVSGSISDHTPGTIMTAVSATWGDLANLVTLFEENEPPDNKYRFLDVTGDESYMFFSGSLNVTALTTVVVGNSAYMDVEITMKGSNT